MNWKEEISFSFDINSGNLNSPFVSLLSQPNGVWRRIIELFYIQATFKIPLPRIVLSQTFFDVIPKFLLITSISCIELWMLIKTCSPYPAARDRREFPSSSPRPSFHRPSSPPQSLAVWEVLHPHPVVPLLPSIEWIKLPVKQYHFRRYASVLIPPNISGILSHPPPPPYRLVGLRCATDFPHRNFTASSLLSDSLRACSQGIPLTFPVTISTTVFLSAASSPITTSFTGPPSAFPGVVPEVIGDSWSGSSFLISLLRSMGSWVWEGPLEVDGSSSSRLGTYE